MRKNNTLAGKQRTLPMLGVLAAFVLGVPSAGLAVAGLSDADNAKSAAFELFTPASVDPDLAARVAEKARNRGIRFTPTGTAVSRTDRTVTVAVRIDSDAARAISVQTGADAAVGKGIGMAGLQASRFNLGTARGYQSFARAHNPRTSTSGVSLDSRLSDLSLPDLAEFAPSGPKKSDEPGRLQPRIELEDTQRAGASPNTLDALSSQTVDLGGSYRLSPNLDVTAGVRLSQERDRIDPLTNSVQDSQAVYVGTQIRF